MTQNTLITGRLIARGAVIVILLIVGWLFLREKTREAFEGRSAGSIQAPPEHDWKRIDNPRGDGWKTEALASEISQQLDRLRAVIAGEGGTGSLSSIAASSFACGDLRPGNLATAYEAPSLVVRRKNTGAGRPEVPPPVSRRRSKISPGPGAEAGTSGPPSRSMVSRRGMASSRRRNTSRFSPGARRACWRSTAPGPPAGKKMARPPPCSHPSR